MDDRATHESGQVLLITAMVMALVLTVIGTVTYRNTTSSRLSKVQEESHQAIQTAQAAAEKFIDAGEQSSSFADLDLGVAEQGIDLDESQVVVQPQSKTEFLTPLVQENQQYTFYTTDYDNTTGTLAYIPDYFRGPLSVHFHSQGGSACPTLEFTFVNENNTVTRKISDPCAGANVFNTNAGSLQPYSITTTNVAGETFRATANVSVNTNTKLMIIRPLGEATKFYITTTNPELPAQGEEVTSRARTLGGVTKTVKVFRSYPQIPAEVFVTSF